MTQLGFDLFARTFEDVHCDVCFIAICELYWCFANALDLFGWKESHAVNQCEICHIRDDTSVDAIVPNPSLKGCGPGVCIG